MFFREGTSLWFCTSYLSPRAPTELRNLAVFWGAQTDCNALFLFFPGGLAMCKHPKKKAMDTWMDRWIYGWINGWINGWHRTMKPWNWTSNLSIFRFHLRRPNSLKVSLWKGEVYTSSSRQSKRRWVDGWQQTMREDFHKIHHSHVFLRGGFRYFDVHYNWGNDPFWLQ